MLLTSRRRQIGKRVVLQTLRTDGQTVNVHSQTVLPKPIHLQLNVVWLAANCRCVDINPAKLCRKKLLTKQILNAAH